MVIKICLGSACSYRDMLFSLSIFEEKKIEEYLVHCKQSCGFQFSNTESMNTTMPINQDHLCQTSILSHLV